MAPPSIAVRHLPNAPWSNNPPALKEPDVSPVSTPASMSLEEFASARENISTGANPGNGTHVISVGGGPRATMQAVAEMELLKKLRKDFDGISALGGRYRIQTTIVERKGPAALGRGNAWGDEQEGTVNTGGEDGSLNYHQRLADYAKKNRSEIEARYDKENPVAAAIFRSAFDGTEAPPGEPVTTRGFLGRRDQGQEELEYFSRMQEEIKELCPFYDLTVLTETEVSHIDISDPAMPCVTLKSMKPKGTSAFLLQANTVRLNTGTTLVSPIKDNKAVKEHSFIQGMSSNALKKFLDNKDLLDDNKKLKSTAKLAVGGTSLSLYDELMALLVTMNLVERDDASEVGYRVTDSAREQYQQAITIISNTQGKCIPPRHAHSPTWTQTIEPLGNAEEQHAAFLHNDGEEVFKAWHNIVKASIAMAFGITPDEVDQNDLTTEELWRRQHESTMRHAEILRQAKHLTGEEKQAKLEEATWTLEGARRQGYFSMLLGLGLTRDIEGTIKRLAEKAPYTFAGRAGYLMHRAQFNAISRPGSATAEDNSALLDKINAAMADVTASPFRVHELAYMLVEAGIATYMSGSYSDLKPDESGKGLSFTSKDGRTAGFDAFIVSPIMKRGAEPALKSLAGQVKPIHPDIPNLGEVTFNRMILVPEKPGQTEGPRHVAAYRPSHVEDYSLNGKGDYIPGTKSKVGIFGFDVNNRESGESVVEGLAWRRFAQAHLAATGSENAVAEVEELYKKYRPTGEDYNNEVKEFEPHFNELMAKNAFLEATKEAAKELDREFLGVIAEKACTSASRNSAHAVALKIKRMGLQDPENEDLIERYVTAMERYKSLNLQDELMAKNAFMEAAKEAAIKKLDGEFFCAIAEKARTPASRNSAHAVALKIKRMGLQDPENEDFIERYVTAMKRYKSSNLQKYAPGSNENFQKRSVDEPLAVHKKVYQDALKLADERARKRRAAPH